ncbi:MAG TPA: hypothetical protein PLN85_02610 [archaeon]|nr:hypothetical protein [archaeon]
MEIIKDKYNNVNQPVKKKIKKYEAPIITTTDLPIEETIEKMTNKEIDNEKIIIESEHIPIKIPKNKGIIQENLNTKEKDIDSNPPIINTEPIKVKRIKKPKRKYTKRKKENTKINIIQAISTHNVPLQVIRVISTLVSIIAIIRTFFYDYVYYRTIDNPFFAGILSALLVMVSFTSPQVLLYAYKNKRHFITLIATLFIILSSYYSIFVSKEVIKLKRIQNNVSISTEQEKVIKARERVKELDSLEVILLQNKEIELRERNSLQEATEKLIADNKTNTKEFDTLRTRLAGVKQRYDDIDKQLQELYKERKELQSIDGYYSSYVKTEKDIEIEFSMDLVFAIFLDFTGPVFLAFSLFL